MNKHLPSKNNNEGIYVLPKIDPTIFDGKLDIVELFVAMLKSEVEDIQNNDRLDNQYFQDKTVFISTINEVITILKNRRIEKSAFSEKNSGIFVM